jgi:putative oxidoreductase
MNAHQTEEAATGPMRPPVTGTDLGLLVLRLGLGIVFVAHGSQKVLGLFGGHGLAGTVQFMGSIGIPAPLAYLACFTEFLGGLGVLGGLLARLSGLGLAIVMAVAIVRVHLSKGFFAPSGFEYPFALLAMALAVTIAGPGRIAIADLEGRLLGRRRGA